MGRIFNKKNVSNSKKTNNSSDFFYLENNSIYMDSACQSLRPQPVIEILNDYYKKYNACGGRVKYDWGRQVDAKIESVRNSILRLLKFSQKDYTVSFTLNTTYGLNLVLQQLPKNKFNRVITSDIEHNSVFLSTISFAKNNNIERIVLDRQKDGSLDLDEVDLNKSVVVLNTISNFDGRALLNLRQIIKEVHAQSGIVIVDAAQTMAHNRKMLENCGADVICFSAHKMYSASLGVIVIKNDLLKSLEFSYIGGGMVSSVSADDYVLAPDNIESHLEPGLQAFGEIISLGKAIEWLENSDKNNRLIEFSEKMYQELKKIDGLNVVNETPSAVLSLYSEKIDAHLLAKSLSLSGIMVRSGYFCCHYYLLEKMKYPPLLRFSIGLHTTEADVDKVIEVMRNIMKGLK